MRAEGQAGARGEDRPPAGTGEGQWCRFVLACCLSTAMRVRRQGGTDVALSSVVMLGHRAEHPGRPFRHLPWALGSRPRVTVEGGGAMCAITAGWRASPTLDRYGAEKRCARIRQCHPRPETRRVGKEGGSTG